MAGKCLGSRLGQHSLIGIAQYLPSYSAQKLLVNIAGLSVIVSDGARGDGEKR